MTTQRRNRDAATDRIFDVLRSERRQMMLAHVGDRDDPVDVEELTDVLAERVDDPRTSIAIELHHVHLPKLDDAGLVEYDARSSTVVPRVDEVPGPVLEFADDRLE